jgi:hypothetical protein
LSKRKKSGIAAAEEELRETLRTRTKSQNLPD